MHDNRCIWCDKQLYTVTNLLFHLKASHDRFLYSTPEHKAIESKMKINNVHIEVRLYIKTLLIVYYYISTGLSKSVEGSLVSGKSESV